MRRRYLKEHRPALYTNLPVTGDLFGHPAGIDRACEDRLACIIRQMKSQENVTESLKSADQMEWVRRMNSIRSRAEEIVMRELIYPEAAE